MLMQADAQRISLKDVPEVPLEAFVQTGGSAVAGFPSPGQIIPAGNYKDEHMATSAVVFKWNGVFKVKVSNTYITPASRVTATITEVTEFSYVPFGADAALEIYQVVPKDNSCLVYGRIWWDSPIFVRVGVVVPYYGTAF